MTITMKFPMTIYIADKSVSNFLLTLTSSLFLNSSKPEQGRWKKKQMSKFNDKESMTMCYTCNKLYLDDMEPFLNFVTFYITQYNFLYR